MAKSRSYPGWQVLLLLAVLGGIVGGWIGNAIINWVPALNFLGMTQSLGIPGFTLDLQVFTFTFGFVLNVNFFTLLGFILAYIFYRRL